MRRRRRFVTLAGRVFPARRCPESACAFVSRFPCRPRPGRPAPPPRRRRRSRSTRRWRIRTGSVRRWNRPGGPGTASSVLLPAQAQRARRCATPSRRRSTAASATRVRGRAAAALDGESPVYDAGAHAHAVRAPRRRVRARPAQRRADPGHPQRRGRSGRRSMPPMAAACSSASATTGIRWDPRDRLASPVALPVAAKDPAAPPAADAHARHAAAPDRDAEAPEATTARRSACEASRLRKQPTRPRRRAGLPRRRRADRRQRRCRRTVAGCWW